jgi:hypothetical protein
LGQLFAVSGKLAVMLSDFARFTWNMRVVLPYPDLPRRVWMRHRAFRLVTIKHWPGDDHATGAGDLLSGL